MSWGAMLAPVAGAVMGQFMGDVNRQKQVQQQRELNAVNEESAKNMGKFNYEQSMKMLKETGPKFQVGQLKEAGMSVGNMYGGSGSGGAIQNSAMSMSPGSAEGVAAGSGATSGMGMLGAQLALIGAQKENIEADTENKKVDAAKKSGIDTDVLSQDLKSKEFDNQVRTYVGATEKASGETAEIRSKEAKADKDWNENEAWKAAAFDGKENTDKNSPLAKAMAAGMEQTIIDLKNAKKDGNIKDAQTVIEKFKAGLASQGLAPDTPWYYKLLSDMLNKAGINPLNLLKK